MARVNCDDSDRRDPRYKRLGKLVAPRLPAHLAAPLGVGIRDALWSYLTDRYPRSRSLVLSAAELEDVTEVTGIGVHLVAAKLAEEVTDGYAIVEATGQVEWLDSKYANGRRGGRPPVIITESETEITTPVSVRLPQDHADAITEIGKDPPALCSRLFALGSDVKKDLTPVTKRDRQEYDLLAVYSRYPRKEGKTKGLEKLKSTIRSQADYDALLKAVDNYAAQVRRLGTEPKYVKHFSTFATSWRDYEDGAALALGNGDPAPDRYTRYVRPEDK